MEIPQHCPAAGVGDELFRKERFPGHLQQQQLFPRSAGSSQVHWEGLEGQVQGGGLGSALQQRTGTLLEGLDVVCAC